MSEYSRYPHGKLNAKDEGQLMIAVHVENGNVRLDFGKETAWIAMPAQQAADFAALIIKYAQSAAGESGVLLMDDPLPLK